MAPYDAIAKRNARDESYAFANKLIGVCDDIISFC